MSQDILNLYLSKDFRDTELSDFGKEQWNYARNYANLLDIDLVLISPLLRTIQTAHLLLKNHPNKENIKYMIHPGVREHVFGYSEIPTDWGKLYTKEYSHLFPNLDVSLMKENGAFNDLFYAQDFQPDLKSKFKGKTATEIEDLIMESVKERFPRSWETLEGTYDRIQKVFFWFLLI